MAATGMDLRRGGIQALLPCAGHMSCRAEGGNNVYVGVETGARVPAGGPEVSTRSRVFPGLWVFMDIRGKVGRSVQNVLSLSISSQFVRPT